MQRRIGQQRVGQRLQAGFGRDLRLGAALLLVRQVQVFQPRLVFGVRDRVEQFRRHLALLRDRGDDRGAPVFQFAQVAQALFQQAQLDVVQAAGGFLAVARDEGHGGAFVQQGDGGGDLHRLGGQFEGEALFDGGQHNKENVKMRSPTGLPLSGRELRRVDQVPGWTFRSGGF